MLTVLAADKQVDTAVQHKNWSFHNYILHSAPTCLISHKPLWSDNLPVDIVIITFQWHDWESTLVVSNVSSRVLISPVPGVLAEYFCVAQGHCGAFRELWNLSDCERHACGEVLLLLLWPPYGIGQAIIFLPCGLFLLLLFFPRLVSAAADWSLPHMVWP